MAETTTKTPGIISRLVEVMAPESKGAQSVAKSVEDAAFASLLAGQASFATHMLSGGLNVSRESLGNVATNLESAVQEGIKLPEPVRTGMARENN